MNTEKYSLPNFLIGKVKKEAYKNWLNAKARIHAKKDNKKSQKKVTVATYKEKIHSAVINSNGIDHYTKEPLNWTKLSKFKKSKINDLPTVDHNYNTKNKKNEFNICSWRTNDCKSDLTVDEFIKFCKIFLKHQAKFILLIFFNISFMEGIYSQNQFQRFFGGNSHDYARSVQQTADGGYIVGGFTESFGAGFSDFQISKTDNEGNISWSKVKGGTSSDWGCSVHQTSDFGYIIAGYTASFSVSGFELYLVKTDSSGNTTWSKSTNIETSFVGTGIDRYAYVKQTSDGGYILTGRTGGGNISLVRLDSNGNLIWFNTYGGSNTDLSNAVYQTSDGGFIIVGRTQSYGAGLYDVYLVKTDSIGNIAWTKTYGGTGNDYGYSIQQTTDNGYILVGQTASFGAGNWDVILIKTDNSGNVLWSKTYGGTSTDYGKYVQQTSDGGYIIVGETNNFGGGDFDIYCIRTNSNGDSLWTKTYGGVSTEEGTSVQQTTDNGFIISGNTLSFGTGLEWNSYLIKIEANGNSGECHEYATNTTINNITPTVNTGGITSTGGTLNSPSTINNNASNTDSVLCAGCLIIVSISSSICINDSIFLQGSYQNSAGVYYDTIVNSVCDSIIETTLTINSLPNVNFNAIGNYINYYAPSISLSGSPSGGVFSGNGVSGNSFNPSVAGLGTKSIIYSYTDINGCSNSSSQSSIVYDTLGNICSDTIPVFDTTYVTITDTTYITVNDTNFVTVYDSISVTDTLIIDVITGLTPPDNVNTIKVFPNPAKDHITIDNGNYSLMSGYSIKITNTLSQIVFQNIINQQQFYIDITTWTGNGTYFVNIYDPLNNLIDVRKIILQ